MSVPNPQASDQPVPPRPNYPPEQGYRAPAPRLRDRIQPLLYPLPGGESSAARSLFRVAFWLALGLLALAGVVAPFVVPDSVRRLTHASVKPVSDASQLPAGSIFRDCKDESCPWLVVVPDGKFTMGSPAGENGRSDDEGPQHKVVIARRLAVMQLEVTRGQFAAFVNETKYQSEGGCFAWNGTDFKDDPQGAWNNVGFPQTDQHPVVCVSWNDARAYAQWQSWRTGQNYRLLSEAEWEYAARAGSRTRYAFGDNPNDLCTYGNVADRSAQAELKEAGKDKIIAECSDGYAYTAPVKSYKSNAFGLYDMHGNVWEWTEDCYHDSYQNAPRDGSAWAEADCLQPIPRGGGWYFYPPGARSAIRYSIYSGSRIIYLGFRLARTLP